MPLDSTTPSQLLPAVSAVLARASLLPPQELASVVAVAQKQLQAASEGATAGDPQVSPRLAPYDVSMLVDAAQVMGTLVASMAPHLPAQAAELQALVDR